MGWNVAWNLAGNLSYAAAQWGMLIVLAKAGNTEMVGLFTLGLAVTAPVFMLTNLQLRTVQVMDARDRFAFGDYLGLRLLGILAALMSIGLVAALREPAVSLVIAAVALTKAVEATGDIAHAALQKRERMSPIALSLMLKGVAALAALLLCLWLSGSLVLGISAVAVVWLLLLLAYDLPNARAVASVRPRFEPRILASLARLALPLGLTMLLISLQANIPRYFLEHHAGVSALGIFGALSYFVFAGSMVINSMGQAASPRLARHYETGQGEAFKRLTTQMIICAGCLGVAAIAVAACFGEWLLGFVYSNEFAQYSDVLLILMLGGAILFIAQVLGYGMTAAGVFKAQPFLFATVGAIVVLCSWLLIPGHGLVGAAWVIVVAAAAQLIGSIGLMAAGMKKSR